MLSIDFGLDNLALIAVLVLANWRVAALFVDDRGLFAVFERLRSFFGATLDQYGTPVAKNEIGLMLVCMWCASFWTGLLLAALFYRAAFGLPTSGYLFTGIGDAAIMIVFALILSGGAIAINRQVKGY